VAKIRYGGIKFAVVDNRHGGKIAVAGKKSLWRKTAVAEKSLWRSKIAMAVRSISKVFSAINSF